jgi:hypothetical protein
LPAQHKPRSQLTAFVPCRAPPRPPCRRFPEGPRTDPPVCIPFASAFQRPLTAFDSRWVPPVVGAPSRHTGTGGATDGVHTQCLRDPGAGDRSRVVPRAAARRSESSGAPKQAARQPDEAMSSRASGWASSQLRRCRAHEEMRGPAGGRAQEGRRQPPDKTNGS